MHDTSPKIEEMMREMIRMKTPFERAQMGASMFETSKYLITQSILRDNPHISETELREQVFLKFYSNDLTSAQKEKILQHIRLLDLSDH